MALYRVFTIRQYRACEFFDIEAKDPKTAKKLAEKAAKARYPDVRATAVDNGWIADPPEPIEALGKSSTGINPTVKILEEKRGTVYQFE